jgi:hypothetical protein
VTAITKRRFYPRSASVTALRDSKLSFVDGADFEAGSGRDNESGFLTRLS